ncbi:MAG: putative electron transfer flavoprotein FixA [Anaerolineae bacterium]
MNIVACCKVTPDPRDIEVKADGSVSLDKAQWIVGEYDLRALEAAVRLVETVGGKVMALSAGPHRINSSSIKKDILSRGPHELYLVVDEALEKADTNLTARVLAAAIKKIGSYDLVLCGEGSSDLYFQQVGLQLGELLGVPTINFISRIEMADGKLTVERSLEEEVEVLDIPLPAVIAVTADINQPRLPTMKEILKAAKKPVVEWSLKDLPLSGEIKPSIRVLRMCSSTQVNLNQVIMFPILLMLEMRRSSKLSNRKQIIMNGSTEEAVRALVDYLTKEGVL